MPFTAERHPNGNHQEAHSALDGIEPRRSPAARQPHPVEGDNTIVASISRRGFNHSLVNYVGITAMAGWAGGFAQRAFGMDKLNFQSIWLNDPEFIGYMIAIDNGYYTAEGLSVNYMPGGPDVIPEGALLSGK